MDNQKTKPLNVVYAGFNRPYAGKGDMVVMFELKPDQCWLEFSGKLRKAWAEKGLLCWGLTITNAKPKCDRNTVFFYGNPDTFEVNGFVESHKLRY